MSVCVCVCVCKGEGECVSVCLLIFFIFISVFKSNDNHFPVLYILYILYIYINRSLFYSNLNFCILFEYVSYTDNVCTVFNTVYCTYSIHMLYIQ